MKPFFCANFFIFFAFLASLGTISNGLSIAEYFDQANEIDDDYDNYEDYGIPIEAEIVFQVWDDSTESVKADNNSDSKRIKPQTNETSVVQNNNCLVDFYQDVFEFLKFFDVFDFFDYTTEEEIQPDVTTEDTLSRSSTTTATVILHEKATNISTTEAPQISMTIAQSINNGTTATPAGKTETTTGKK